MSKVSINQYYSQFDKAIQFGKSRNETSIRNYFWILLNEYARKQHYEVIPELRVKGTLGKEVQPDGVVKNNFYLDIGLWESKDEKTSLDEEIDAKIKKGYPLTNILFEDSATAILYQRGEEVMRVSMRDADKLDKILVTFFSFKNEFVSKFEAALEKFKEDIPHLVETLRKRIEDAGKTSVEFIASSNNFLELCRVEINPTISEEDIREMMIQHILTSDIFTKIFDDAEFHRHNNIASELEALINSLFTYSDRRNLLHSIEHYYDAINLAASAISDHHEKQKFLKLLYENFYKVYNPKAADRLGVVYTPNEIVQFMIESTDYLLHKHFGKTLADKNVEILDPATGTGTFITSLIDYLPNQSLMHKYKEEIHANEVAILPYYIANLNIEYTFKQKMGVYEEYMNLCFVDTLDNTTALTYGGKQHQLFGLSSENAERIKRQNEKKISVVIGNPPYNASQLNENENNKKRDYLEIDKRIKDTYVKYSTAQKTKVYDMYARFFRWACDRIKDEGVVAFITNNSFIKAKGFDGFRNCIKDEFDHAYVIDLDGDIRSNSNQSKGNVFNIMVGVSITFLIKCNSSNNKNCKIHYHYVDSLLANEKIEFLKQFSGGDKFENIAFQNINPDKNNDWLKLTNNDFESLMPMINKAKGNSLFEISSNGISTNRDEWVYDFNKTNLEAKSKFFIDEYNSEVERWIEYKKKENYIDIKAESNPILDNFLHSRNLIKWSKMIKRDKLRKHKKDKFLNQDILKASYRPYCKRYLYFGYIPIDLKGAFDAINNPLNKIIAVNHTSSKDFNVLSTDAIVDLHFNGDSICLPLYRYSSSGERIDNVTDWGLEQFRTHYGSRIENLSSSKTNQAEGSFEHPAKSKEILTEYSQPHLDANEDALLHEPKVDYAKNKQIEKENIFHYVYGVLHDPAYRQKYELNLKREFPRIPFYDDFWKWAAWGQALINLHISYEDIDKFPLIRFDNPKNDSAKIKVKLKANKVDGIIEIDDLTSLSNIPSEAWEYKLGNRSALEWILDQYKEKKPSDHTIAEKFDTYRFSDHKEKVIDLIMRVCSVSVQTVKITTEMKEN